MGKDIAMECIVHTKRLHYNYCPLERIEKHNMKMTKMFCVVIVLLPLGSEDIGLFGIC